MVMVFVLGICCIREDARLLIQHGSAEQPPLLRKSDRSGYCVTTDYRWEIILGLTQLATQNIGNIEVPLAYQIYSQQYGIASF